MTRIELTYEDDPLEISMSVEHPDCQAAKATAHDLARHLLEPVPQRVLGTMPYTTSETMP